MMDSNSHIDSEANDPFINQGDAISKFSDSTYRASELEMITLKPTFFGTHEESVIWWNSSNRISILLSSLVLACIIFAATSISLIYFEDSQMNLIDWIIIICLCILSIWSHLMTMLCDPGAVPQNAHPLPRDIRTGMTLTICGCCDAYKPSNCHHDRISGRCITRMDHFCPWTNNAIGAKNQKNFILFLIYTDVACIYILALLLRHSVSKLLYE